MANGSAATIGYRSRQSARRFESRQHRYQICAETIRQISALLHEHGGQAEACDRSAELPESLRLHLQASRRIVLRGQERMVLGRAFQL
jgi:hypothetical protein